jgi:hypothetical protein
MSSYELHVIPVRFYSILNFLNSFSKYTIVLIINKFWPVVSKFSHANERKKPTSNIRNTTVVFDNFQTHTSAIQNQLLLHKVIFPNVPCFQCDCYFKFPILSMQLILILFLQNWGDYTDMSQAATVYVTYASDVVLICWFGTQLTQHVRQNDLLLLLLTFITFCVQNFYGESNQLRNYGPIRVLSIFQPNTAFWNKLPLA